VRILFTFVGGRGHFEPLVPVARAAAAAGHEVTFAGQPSMMPTVATAGFLGFAIGLEHAVDGRRPLLEPSQDREERVLRTSFAGRTARKRAPDVLSLCASWRPDLLVCDEIDFGGMIAAEILGIPHVAVAVTATGSFVRPEVVAEPVDRLRTTLGLSPDPDLEMAGRYLVLSPFPPGLRDPAFPPPPTTHSIRPAALEPTPGDVAPPWLTRLGHDAMVYVTLGTIFNLESGDLFHRILAGLRGLPIEVVATVGPDIDPADLGPHPDHVHLERYVPQSLVLARGRAVVSHAGSGSVVGALAFGLPSVLLPMGADQMLNAARCEALAVGRTLHPVRATPDDVRDAVAAVLGDPSYRKAAERMRDEIASLPGPDHAVTLLERLAMERRPILA
jgi:UDP:flavonoid glycosyltransferase YjiC (YdhE family)